MWEDIAEHREEEVEWYQLNPMEIANCKCDAVAKQILFLSIINNCKPVNRFPIDGLQFMVVPFKISCLISNMARNHKRESQARLFITTKGQISNKGFELVN